MGKMIKIACTSCKNEWECITGSGLSHALLQNAVQAFPEEIGKKVMGEIEEEFPIFEFGYCISVCGCCAKIVNVPVLNLEDGNTEYIGPCPVCGEEVSLITDIDEAVCPVCKNKTLSAEETGRWD